MDTEYLFRSWFLAGFAAGWGMFGVLFYGILDPLKERRRRQDDGDVGRARRAAERPALALLPLKERPAYEPIDRRTRAGYERCPRCQAECIRSGELLLSAQHAYVVYTRGESGSTIDEIGRPVHSCSPEPAAFIDPMGM